MRTADSALRDLNARLKLPARQRALLLRELRADFEDLVATLVAEGLSTDAAVARAVQLLTPSVEDADVLTGLHRPPYVRLVARLQPSRVRLLERSGITAMAVLAVMAPMLTLGRVTRLSPVSLAVLGGVATLLVVNLSWQTFRIVVRREADAGDLARAGKIQAGLVALALAAGTSMVAMEAYRELGPWAHGTPVAAAAVVGALATCAVAAALTLGLTILGAFGALALLQWQASARGVEEELHALLAPRFSSNEP